jgi:hypothetical protein
MNPYEKLDHEQEPWDVKKTAAFLGCTPKHIYRLIRQGKIEGWMKIDGRYRFFPCKLKAWIETNLNHKRGLVKPYQSSTELPENERVTKQANPSDEVHEGNGNPHRFDPVASKALLEKWAASSTKYSGQNDSTAKGGQERGWPFIDKS